MRQTYRRFHRPMHLLALQAAASTAWPGEAVAHGRFDRGLCDGGAGFFSGQPQHEIYAILCGNGL